jgi:outer membrane lipoprotein-sorting protein
MNRDLALPLILLAAVAIGCSQIRDSEPTNSANSGEVNAPANVATNAAPAMTRENPAADIEAMADKFLAEKTFRAKMRGTGDKEVKTDLEFVAPDRFRIKTGPGLETIVIGKDVYLSMNGSFEKLPGAMDGSIPDLRATFNKEGRKWFSDVKYVGEESVGGKPSLVYEYKNKGEGNLGENDSKIWVGKDDGLPLKIESRYKRGNLKTMVIEYEYDPNIKIEAPVKK